MRALLISLAGLLAAVVLLFLALIILYDEVVLLPAQQPEAMPLLESNQMLVTVNTTRIGSDDPVETAVAVSQIIYPATEEENVPGAVVLVNRDSLPEVMLAASRVQHFPVNAPLLYVDEDFVPRLTRDELLRLKPEGVPQDGNTQVYLVGTVGDRVQRDVEQMGFNTRSFRAENPIALSEMLDDWASTLEGDHPNAVVVANLDNPFPAIPSVFWNAHAGDALVFVTNEGIPQTTIDILSRRANGPWLYLFGDESTISVDTARELANYGHVTRIPRSELSAASAYFAGFRDVGANWGAWIWQDARDFGWGLAEAGHNATFVNLEGPGGWQNAVVATTLSHMGKHGPVLIVDRGGIPEVVGNYLRLLKPYPTAPRQQLLNHGWVIGGEETISWEVQATLDILLDGYFQLPEAEGG